MENTKKVIKNKMINVTKSYLPPIEEYVEEITRIWDTNWLTNYGPLSIELENKLKERFDNKNIHYVNNGTVAIEIAINTIVAEDKEEIITTPFSFIATASSILWLNKKPIFVDIEKKHFNVDVNKIEEKISNKTAAMLFVHCFGFPCDVERIKEIAEKYNLKVIYDAAHCFDVKYNGKYLFSYGDIATCSLHATKVFHTVEGGLVIVNNEQYNDKVNAIKNFGNHCGKYEYVGINAKNSEFHAAMGLCILKNIENIKNRRKKIYNCYTKNLKGLVEIPDIPKNCEYNYIYYPIIFKDEKQLLMVLKALENENIYARRYFYPSLNSLGIFHDNNKYENSEDIASRIACLPLDSYLSIENAKKICKIIKEHL